ncbi:MAG: hypothetical protein NTU98_00095 [Bacteroidetes bacterium]|nr:hypothetical protein [Bacteroidota bacterium]
MPSYLSSIVGNSLGISTGTALKPDNPVSGFAIPVPGDPFSLTEATNGEEAMVIRGEKTQTFTGEPLQEIQSFPGKKSETLAQPPGDDERIELPSSKKVKTEKTVSSQSPEKKISDNTNENEPAIVSRITSRDVFTTIKQEVEPGSVLRKRNLYEEPGFNPAEKVQPPVYAVQGESGKISSDTPSSGKSSVMMNGLSEGKRLPSGIKENQSALFQDTLLQPGRQAAGVADLLPVPPPVREQRAPSHPQVKLVIGKLTVEVIREPEKKPDVPPAKEKIIVQAAPQAEQYSHGSGLKIKFGLGQL